MAIAIYGLDRMSREKHGPYPEYTLGTCMFLWWVFLLTGFLMVLGCLFSGWKIVRSSESQENNVDEQLESGD